MATLRALQGLLNFSSAGAVNLPGLVDTLSTGPQRCAALALLEELEAALAAAPSPPREPQALPDAIATKFWREALRTLPSDCLDKFDIEWIEQRARDLARKAGT